MEITDTPDSDNEERRNQKMLLSGTILYNSLLAFLLSALLIFMLENSLKYMWAYIYNYPVDIHHFQISYLIENSRWSFQSVMAVFVSVPFTIGFLGFIAAFILHLRPKATGRYKVWLIWFSFQAISFLVFDIFLGTMVYEGIGFALAWFYPGTFEIMAIMFFCLVGMVVLIKYYARYFFQSANIYYDQLTENDYPLFITAQALVPYLLGFLFLAVFFWFNFSLKQWVALGGMGLLLIVIIFAADPDKLISFDPRKRNTNPYMLLIFPLLVLAVSFWYLYW